MADINKTVSIEYSANVDKLLTNLKKVPGMTDKEAKKMSKALSTELKKTEVAAKKAANANVKAMKKIPKTPPIFDAESTLFTHLLGNLISKYPKNEIAKTIKIIKKIILLLKT